MKEMIWHSDYQKYWENCPSVVLFGPKKAS